MGLFDKIKEILFDEETVEIPIITKEEPERRNQSKPIKKEEDEVIVHKISSNVVDDEELFDMPKLKEEAREEVRTSTFTFPIFDDEDLDIKDVSRSNKKHEEKEEVKEKTKTNTRKYDFLSSTDYRAKKEDRNSYSSRLSSLEEDKNSKKPFTPSPIISPVYGILNENYKKEDIITRTEAAHITNEKIDLDSVRKKAYGSLEDELEATLTNSEEKKSDVLDEVPTKEELTIGDLSDDGLTIDDLLMDDVPSVSIDDEEENELFKIDEDVAEPEIELDDVEEKEVEKNNEALGEEDLFDLIDSLYAGKGEN